MKEVSTGHYYGELRNKKVFVPLSGLLHLSYRCNLECVHCYCKGSENKAKELSTAQFKKVLDDLAGENCLWLTFSGGEPLVRKDFLELYVYAKQKGFIVSVFTNATLFTDAIIRVLKRFPPYSIEVTINGITAQTYESITGVAGSFDKALKNIRALVKNKLPVILKTNCLKQNKDEIVRIKQWAEEFLGSPGKNNYRFKYDTMIYPRLNGDTTPCRYRLSFDEISVIQKQDPDLWREYQKNLECKMPGLSRKPEFLYHCNSWMTQFFIDPFGRLKFCNFSDKFSIDLRTASFKKGFYETFPRVLSERFKENSPCCRCELRSVCCYCPSIAYLETGNEEKPITYFCSFAKKTSQDFKNKRRHVSCGAHIKEKARR